MPMCARSRGAIASCASYFPMIHPVWRLRRRVGRLLLLGCTDQRRFANEGRLAVYMIDPDGFRLELLEAI